MATLEARKARAMATKASPAEYRGVPFAGTEIRSVPSGTGGTKLKLTGYASVTGAPYELSDHLGTFTETIAPGAFRDTLAANADVQLKVDHSGVSMARTRSGTMKLAEDQTGLHVEARIDPKRPDVKILRSALESGDVDEWSFAFRVSPGGDNWSDDYQTRRITALSLHLGDVSVCNRGANPHTGGLIDLRNKGFSDPAKVMRRLGVSPAGRSVTSTRPRRELTLRDFQMMSKDSSGAVRKYFKRLGYFE
jgi:HK97 family phage prohead protease